MFSKMWALLKRLGNYTVESNARFYPGFGWQVPYIEDRENKD